MPKENSVASARILLASKGLEVSPVKKPHLKSVSRTDSWTGAQGFGVQHSANNSQFSRSKVILPWELESLYRDDWVAGKGVDKPADDMTRKGYDFTPNDEDDPKKAEDFKTILTDDYDQMVKAKEAIAFSRLAGGSATFFHYGGSEQEQAMPIEDSQKKKILRVTVFPSFDAVPLSWYRDFDHPKFNQPEHYQILIKGQAARTIVVHESRLIIMQGRLNTPLSRGQNLGWYDSMLQRAYQPIRDFQISSSSIAGVMEDFVYKTLGIDNLSSLIMESEDDVILDNIMLAAQKVHIGNVGVYDSSSANAGIEKHGTPVGGLAELSGTAAENVCGAFSMARSILYSNEGGTLGGNAAQADQDNYTDGIESGQEIIVRPWINEFNKNVSIVEYGDELKIPYMFPPLRQLSQKEEVEIIGLMTDNNVKNVEAGILSVEEVRSSSYPKPKPDPITIILDQESFEQAREEASEEEMDQMADLQKQLTQPKEEPQEKTDSAPIVITPKIIVEQPDIKVVIPEQKDNTDDIKDSIKKEFANFDEALKELKEKFDDQDIKIELDES